MITLATEATEGSTLVVTCTFASEVGNPVTPTSEVVWRLLDENNRQLANGSEAAADSVDIVLTGSDLSISNPGASQVTLTLVVETTYNSANGTGLSLVEKAEFVCNNVLGSTP